MHIRPGPTVGGELGREVLLLLLLLRRRRLLLRGGGVAVMRAHAAAAKVPARSRSLRGRGARRERRLAAVPGRCCLGAAAGVRGRREWREGSASP